MFRIVLAKEIRHSLYSFRYMASFIIVFLLILGTAYTHGNSYQKDRDQYRHDQLQRSQLLDSKAHVNRLHLLLMPIQPPMPLEVFISNQAIDAMSGSFFKNPVYLLHRKFDLVDVFVFFIGIVALMLSYDGISGEKEAGTLRLLSAYSVSRPLLLLSKLVAGFSVIIIPLMLGILFALVYLLAKGLLSWSSGEWFALLGILFTGILHFSFYFSVGLIASSTTRKPSSSIVVAFLIWVVFVFIIPHMSPFLAAQIVPIPGIEKTKALVRTTLSEERDNLGRVLEQRGRDSIAQHYPHIVEQINLKTPEQLANLIRINRDIRRVYEMLEIVSDSAWARANAIQQEKADKLINSLKSRLKQQSVWSQYLAYVSPSADMAYAAMGFAGFGQFGYDYYYDQVTGYYNHLQPYIAEKVATQKKEDPLFSSNDFLDVSDRPRFHWSEMPIALRWQHVRLPVAILLIYNVIAFTIANIRFQYYDIR